MTPPLAQALAQEARGMHGLITRGGVNHLEILERFSTWKVETKREVSQEASQFPEKSNY